MLGSLNVESCWRISRELKVSPTAVRDRLQKLFSDGVIKRITLIPDSSRFGLTRTMVVTQGSDEFIRRMEEKLRLLDFVEALHIGRCYYPNTGMNLVSIVIIHKSEEDLERKVRLVKDLVGDFQVAGKTGSTLRNGTPVTKNECEILRKLIRNPSMSTTELSRLTRLSPKTLRKHVRALVASNSFFLEPTFDSQNMRGAILFVASTMVEEKGKRAVQAKMRTLFPNNYLLFNDRWDNVLFPMFFAASFAEMRQCFDTITKAGLQNTMFLMPFKSVYNEIAEGLYAELPRQA